MIPSDCSASLGPRFIGLLLACIALASVACSDGGVDACTTDRSCPNSQICRGGLCVPGPTDGGVTFDGGFEDTGLDASAPDLSTPDASTPSDAGENERELRIVGRAIPNAEVRVEVGTELIETTASADGTYRVALGALAGEATVAVRAVDPADRFVELATLLGSVSELSARAGDDLLLDLTEAPETRLSGFTTLRYAVAWLESGGRLPRTDPERRRAELALNGTPIWWEREAGAVGASLEALARGSSRPPGSATLLGIALDPPRLRAVLGGLDEAEVMRAATEDPTLFETFAPASARRLLVGYHPSGNGVASTSSRLRRWIVSGERGELVGGSQLTPGTQVVAPPVPMTLSLGDSGGLRARFDVPAETDEVTLAVGDIARYFSDPARGRSVQDAVAACLQRDDVRVRREHVESEILRTPGGHAVELTITRERWALRFDALLRERCPSGQPGASGEQLVFSAPPATYEDAIAEVPFEADELSGETWVVPLPVPALTDNASWTPLSAGDVVLTSHVVSFSADGSAEARSPWPATSDRSAQWRLRADGALELTSELGGVVLRRTTRLPTEDGVIAEYFGPQGIHTVQLHRVRAVDPGFALDLPTLRSGPGDYWQTTVNHPVLALDASGRVPLSSFNFFGFRFLPGPEVVRLDSLVDADTGQPRLTEDRGWTLAFEEGRVRQELWVDRDNAPCIPRSSPDCWRVRSRSWWPVAADADGFFVVELASVSRWLRARWDASQQAYVANGAVVDRAEQEIYILPRLMRYLRAPLP